MKMSLFILLVAALLAGGCTTKSQARADANASYLRGQAQAMAVQSRGRLPPPAPPNTVAIIGPVQVTALKWTPDLTLLKTIVAAEYIPAGDPSQINIIRSAQRIPVSAQALLDGRDVPLRPRDVVELQP